jgi:acetyl-CoA synthetase
MLHLKDYRDYEDFATNYRLDIPDNFNFAFDCVDKTAAEDPDKTAIIWCGDDAPTVRYSFDDVRRYSDGAALYFRSLGIGKGDRVIFILKRHIHFWFALLGLQKIGAIAIPTTHHITADDVVYRMNRSEAVAIITTDDAKLIEIAETAAGQAPSLRYLIRTGTSGAPGSSDSSGTSGAPGTPGRWLTLDAEMRRLARSGEAGTLTRVTENDDTLLIYFTSGTTGMPKMVAHNYLYPLAHTVTAKYWQNLHENSLHFTISDTGWGKAAWGKIYGQWLCGATVLVYEHEKLNAHRLLKVLEENRVTSFCAPPTAYRVLLKAKLENYDLSTLEYATSAGEPLDEELFQRFKSFTGISIMEAYGQTETVPIVLTPPYIKPVPGSIGKPNPLYDLRFIGEDGEEVGPGEDGEMCIKATPNSPGVFMGYYRNDEMMAEAWRGGYYHTGDLASRDEDGYVWFIGRSDDIIKSAGYRIGPFEVESVVNAHPAVHECAVTGVPDPLRGQRVKASITLNEGYEPSDDLKKEIRAFVKANAASYKIPRIIEFVGELPKTISGKVRRKELRG